MVHTDSPIICTWSVCFLSPCSQQREDNYIGMCLSVLFSDDERFRIQMNTKSSEEDEILNGKRQQMVAPYL